MQRAFRLIQAILGIIGYILNHKGNTVAFKVLQNIHNLFFTDRKCFVILIDPTGIGLVERQTTAAGVIPGYGQNIFAGDLHNDLVTGTDLFLLFFIPGQSKGRDTGH